MRKNNFLGGGGLDLILLGAVSIKSQTNLNSHWGQWLLRTLKGLVALGPFSPKFSKTAKMKLSSLLIHTANKFLGVTVFVKDQDVLQLFNRELKKYVL